MAANWQLLGIMMGYAFFNGIGSYFYKRGLQRFDHLSISFISVKKSNLQALLQLFLTPIWILGLICLGIDFLIYQVALRSYEVSVVKPLVNLNLIFVLLFGIGFLHEQIRWREWAGIGAIISGALLITLNSTTQETRLNLEAFWLFLGSSAIILGIFYFLLRKSDRISFEYGGSIICGILYGLGSVFNKGFYATNVSGTLRIGLGGFFGISYLLAFLFGQTAYLKGRMSMVSVLVNILSILTPFLGGIILFNDRLLLDSPRGWIRWSKLLGLGSILIGISLSYQPMIATDVESQSSITPLHPGSDDNPVPNTNHPPDYI